MKILVDADACPVKDIITEVAQKQQIPVIWVASIEHNIQSQYGQIIVVDHEPEAADLYIVNHTDPNDIVITQDLGLASLVLVRGARALTPSGTDLGEKNIEALLTQRYLNKKARSQGYRIGRTRSRTPEDNRRFRQVLISTLIKNDSKGQ